MSNMSFFSANLFPLVNWSRVTEIPSILLSKFELLYHSCTLIG